MMTVFTRNLPDEFSAEKHPECQRDHVVRTFAIIIHRVQCHGYMRMTIVATQIVLEQSVTTIRNWCYRTDDVTIRFLYSSEACSTALSQMVRRLPDVGVLEMPLRSS